MDQAQLRTSTGSDLVVNRAVNTNVQLEDLGFTGAASAAMDVRGGNVDVFSCASSGNRVSVRASGGQLLVRDCWYEGGTGPGYADAEGRAVLTVDGGRIASPADGTPPAFDIRDLVGRVSIVNADIDDRIAVIGDGSQAMVLALGAVREQRSAQYFENTTSPPARAMLLNSRHLSTRPGVRTEATANVGTADPAFIREMLRQTRKEMPQPLHALPAGVTDFRMFRVWVTNGLNNVVVNP